MKKKNKVRNECILVLTMVFAVTLMNVYEGLALMALIVYMAALVVVIVHSTIHPDWWNGEEEDYE